MSRARDGESVDRAVGFRIPGCGQAGGHIERRDVVASLPADGVKAAAGVDSRARDDEGVYGGGAIIDGVADSRVGVPVGSKTARRIKGGDAVAVLTADRGELSAGVDGRTRDGESLDLVGCVWIEGWVRASHQPGCARCGYGTARRSN